MFLTLLLRTSFVQNTVKWPPNQLPRGLPLGLLQHEGVSEKRILYAGLDSGKRATWPKSRSWRSLTMHVTDRDPDSRSSSSFLLKFDQWYPKTLFNDLVPKSSSRFFSASVKVNSPGAQRGLFANLSTKGLILGMTRPMVRGHRTAIRKFQKCCNK